jgi:hypothetical protein
MKKKEFANNFSLCNFECTLNNFQKNVNNIFTKRDKSDILITSFENITMKVV